MNSTLATVALATALGLALSAPANAQDKGGKPMTAEQKRTMERMVKHNLEKCYGIAARGRNDCAEGAHSCIGQAAHDRDKGSFVLLPKGDCQKIAGGSLKAS